MHSLIRKSSLVRRKVLYNTDPCTQIHKQNCTKHMPRVAEHLTRDIRLYTRTCTGLKKNSFLVFKFVSDFDLFVVCIHCLIIIIIGLL